jgi:hypothetical protein
MRLSTSRDCAVRGAKHEFLHALGEGKQRLPSYASESGICELTILQRKPVRRRAQVQLGKVSQN